jgi:hypothetical protein
MSKKKDTPAAPATMRRLFVPITRVDEIDEETCEVVGIATSEAVDSFGTIFDFDASKKAYERWAEAFSRMTDGESQGNVREMHQKSAVGKVIEWKPNEADRSIEIRTRIVGKDVVRKCRERIYTGFSHGVWPNSPPKKERANGQIVERYTDFDVREVSLADSPSNPESLFLIVRLAEDGKTVTPLQAAIAAVPPRRRAPAEPEETAAPAVAAAVPEVPAPAAAAPPTPAAPAPAVTATEVAAPAPVPPAPPAAPAPAAERARAALQFDLAKFTPETASAWAQAHGFRAARVIERAPAVPATAGERLFVLQRSTDQVTNPHVTRLAEGVELVTTEVPADAPATRLRAILRTAEPAILERVRSEGGPIMAGLQALASLVQAIDNEMFAGYTGAGTNEADRAAVATLTDAAETILDFCGGAFRKQLASMGAEVQRVATSELERFVQLPKVLTPAQLQRVMDEGELRENVSAMHGIGHALCDATMQMGGACEGNRCERVNDGEEEQPGAPETKEPDNDGGTPPPKKEEAEAEKKEKERLNAPAPPAPAAPAPPAPSAPASAAAAAPVERSTTSNGNDQVLQAIGRIEEQVKASVRSLIEPLDTRLRQVESTPSRIGLPPAAPVEKRLAGSTTPATPTPADDADTLTRLAATETDPARKAALLQRAAEETIRAMQIAGRR